MADQKEMFTPAEQVGRKIQEVESCIVRLILERDTTDAKRKATADGWKNELARIDKEIEGLKDQRAMLIAPALPGTGR